RMRLLGATVHEVDSGSRTLKDATNEAMRDWMGSVGETHYILGSVVGPHPFPTIVRELQSVIGVECRAQCLETLGRLPDAVVACVGGGSNAAGIFAPFVPDRDVRLVGVEAGGRGTTPGGHAAPLAFGSPGVLHGSLSYVLQDEEGQTADVHSCSAGLDYPGVGPEHAHWKDTGRVEYRVVDDAEALTAFQDLSRLEGIIPALETAHAIAASVRLAAEMPAETNLVLNCSGRGDKDVQEVMRLLESGSPGRRRGVPPPADTRDDASCYRFDHDQSNQIHPARAVLHPDPSGRPWSGRRKVHDPWPRNPVRTADPAREGGRLHPHRLVQRPESLR
ncbi:MAG TPA: hypothetical protein DCG14_05440, partial [Phycisphaerales bacterium]|nr:hypothetical protein [Phycisphaerales bacterium]